MPTLLEEPATDASPFADLIGGDNGGPAYQTVAGRFSEVPKAEVVTPTDLGAFADMVPGPGRDVEMPAVEQDLGIFQAYVPESPTKESEKALAEVPKPPDPKWLAFEKGIENVSGQPFHQVSNAIRVFGQSAGRYIFDGMQAFERGRAQFYKNPPQEATQVPGDQLHLPDGSRMSKAEEDALEAKYSAELSTHAPAALENAAELKRRSEEAERNTPIDPALAKTVPARLAAAAGPVAVMTGESMIPGLGLPLMVMHGALATEQEALDAGATPSQAQGAAVRSAIGLAIFGGFSKFAAAAVAKALPWLAKNPSQAVRFVTQFVGQEAANETSSRTISAWNAAEAAPEGQKVQAVLHELDLTNAPLENTVMNTMYALAHAAKASRPKSEPPSEPPTSPASEPVEPTATTPEGTPETARYVEPAREAVATETAPASGDTTRSISPATTDVPHAAGQPAAVSQESLPTRPRPEPTAPEPEGNDWTTATQEAPAEPIGVEAAIAEIQRRNAPAPRPVVSPERDLISRLTGKEAPVVERVEATVQEASRAMQDVVNESRKTGLVAPGSTGIQGGIEHLGKIWRQIRDLPKFGDFKKAILGFGQKMQSSFLEAKEVQRTLKRAVPSRVAREGIFNYIEAGGDKATLTTWRDASPERDLKRGYDAALNLTPEQLAIADHLRTFYTDKLAEGQAAGIVSEGRENYINRIVDKRRSKGFAPVTAGGSGVGPGSSGRLSKNFKHGLHRVYENTFDAERNGIRYKTKDVAELAPIYLTEMNKTIGTRQLLADLAHGTAEDGRALAFPKGSMATLTGKEGETTSRLIKPNTKQMVLDEITGQDVSSHDYSTVEHPALNGWKWVGADNEGKPILVQGNLALHPEIANHVKNLLGESALRRWYNSDGSPLASLPKGLIRNIDKSQQVAKELLFSGSGFHHANIGFHAVEHRVNPLPEFFKSLSRAYTIDPADPKVRDWMGHSLQLAPDQLSARHFMEGFGGRAVEKVPLYGKIASAISDHLFERFIPALKLRLANAMLDRNMHLFAGDIAANKVTPDQVKYLSAQQANSALSHINYIDIGRNPTMQHLLSLSTLAPDFSESRARFLFQAGKTLTGSKAGVEQFAALAYGAGLIWSMARIINKVADDDYHFEEPFGVVHNGRVYGIRSIQGDVWHMIKDPRKFTYGRVSPLVKLGLEQFITGTNYRGEKISHLESLKEYFANYVPISFKNVPGLRDLFETTKNNPVTPWESFMGAMGIQASRYSPITKTYQLARDWEKAAGIPEDKGSYPISKYQQLRYALEDGDMDRAKAEYQKLVDSGEKRDKITSGFRQSILHAFTGSEANDAKFKKSLSPEDKQLYDLAVRKRHEILRKYQALRPSAVR